MNFSRTFGCVRTHLSHPVDLEYVLAAVALSTLAGNLTLLGSVANIIVIETAKAEDEMGFVTYFKAGLPVTIVSMAVGIGYLLLTK